MNTKVFQKVGTPSVHFYIHFQNTQKLECIFCPLSDGKSDLGRELMCSAAIEATFASNDISLLNGMHERGEVDDDEYNLEASRRVGSAVGSIGGTSLGRRLGEKYIGRYCDHMGSFL